MVEWHAADFGQLIPPPVEEFIAGVTPVITVITAILEPISIALGVLESILALTDPGAMEFVTALETLMDEIISTILGSGFYYLPMWDHGLLQLQGLATDVSETDKPLLDAVRDNTVTFNEFLVSMHTTLIDRGDVDRPQFTGSCAGVAIVVAANGFDEFIGLFDAFRKLMPTNAELQRIEDKIQEVLDILNQTEPDLFSYPYDWADIDSEDIVTYLFPDFAKLLKEYMMKILLYLEVAKGVAAAFAEFIKLFRSKIDGLVDLLNDLNDTLTNLKVILSATGIFIAYNTSGSGMIELSRGIKEATNAPYNGKVFVSGAMFAVGSDGVSVFDTLFGSI